MVFYYLLVTGRSAPLTFSPLDVSPTHRTIRPLSVDVYAPVSFGVWAATKTVSNAGVAWRCIVTKMRRDRWRVSLCTVPSCWQINQHPQPNWHIATYCFMPRQKVYNVHYRIWVNVKICWCRWACGVTSASYGIMICMSYVDWDRLPYVYGDHFMEDHSDVFGWWK